MADEAVVGEDAAQIRVAAEQDAEQVEGLALEPVGARPDLGHRVEHRLGAVRAAHPEPQPLVVLTDSRL